VVEPGHGGARRAGGCRCGPGVVSVTRCQALRCLHHLILNLGDAQQLSRPVVVPFSSSSGATWRDPGMTGKAGASADSLIVGRRLIGEQLRRFHYDCISRHIGFDRRRLSPGGSCPGSRTRVNEFKKLAIPAHSDRAILPPA
jgi:hypothetical protein